MAGVIPESRMEWGLRIGQGRLRPMTSVREMLAAYDAITASNLQNVQQQLDVLVYHGQHATHSTALGQPAPTVVGERK